MATVDELRGWLEQLVPEPIAGVDRQRIRYIGSYDCDTVTVHLVDGTTRCFFLKDFGRTRQSKDERDRRRDREMFVYRNLLSASELGTPKCFGSLWDGSRGRYWLLLEMVEAVVVKTADLHYGALAAAWLARMQAHFMGQASRLDEADYLVRHDAAYFRDRAEAARHDVATIAPACAARIDRALAGHDRVIDLMTRQPQSLVHGGYIAWHIMVDERREPARVCVIDWELAARGATLYDLAYFTDDAEPAVRGPIIDAYRQAAAVHGVPVPDDAARVIACFRLQRIIDWLSRAGEKGFSAKKVMWLVAQLEAAVPATR